MDLNTCRFCKKAGYEPHRYGMLKYGPRHWAHADCALKKHGGNFFAKLTPYQLSVFPAFAAINASLGEELRQAIEARPYIRRDGISRFPSQMDTENPKG